jgi:hypothetical protein
MVPRPCGHGGNSLSGRVPPRAVGQQGRCWLLRGCWLLWLLCCYCCFLEALAAACASATYKAYQMNTYEYLKNPLKKAQFC